MNKIADYIHWNELRVKLEKKFPLLTSADLEWRYTTQEDLLSNIANKLGKTRNELKEIMELG